MEFLKQLFVSLFPLILIFGIPFIAVMVYRIIRRKIGKARGGGIENSQRMEPNIIWKWRGIRWLIGYLVFWLVAGGGAGIIARSSSPEIQEGASSGFATFIVFIFLIWCVVKDRGNKTTLQKVGWVVGLWLAHAIVSVIVTFTLAEAGIGDTGNLQRMSNMIAGYIILYFAMRRSTVFVEQLTSSRI